jgi:hypothetical protein
MSDTNTIDRRQQPRYHFPPNHKITTKVTSIAVENCGPDDIRFVNYSYSGLGLESEHIIPVGTAMQLEMSIENGIPVSLKAMVNNRRKKGDSYYYGAYFEYIVSDNDIDATRASVEKYIQSSFDF